MNHPLHPLLVHLPVGLWTTSVLFDIFYMANHNPQVATASFYCMVVGIAGGLLAIPAGLADYVDIAPKTVAKRLATAHMLLNFAVTGLFMINALSRYHLSQGAPLFVSTSQLILSLLSIVLLAVSGYVGGLLVFEFGIGQRSVDHKNGFSSAASDVNTYSTSTSPAKASDHKKVA